MADYRVTGGSFFGVDQCRIFYQSWKAHSPRGVVAIAHGLGEHSGRYSNLVDSMAGDRVSIYSMDHRGHGRSEGQRGHVNRFSEYVEDLNTMIQLIRTENPEAPLIVFGHSMGGVIAYQYTLNYPREVNGLILSSAGLMPSLDQSPVKLGLVRILSRLVPSTSVATGLDSKHLSHDQTVVSDYINDPLVHDKVSCRWFMEFVQAGKESLSRAEELKLPLLIIHGSDDQIVNVQGSREVMAKASSQDKGIHIYEGLYHETLNEVSPDKDMVLDNLRGWILGHL